MINKEVKDSVMLFNRLRRALIILVGFALFSGVASSVLIESKVVGNVIFFFAVLAVIVLCILSIAVRNVVSLL